VTRIVQILLALSVICVREVMCLRHHYINTRSQTQTAAIRISTQWQLVKDYNKQDNLISVLTATLLEERKKKKDGHLKRKHKKELYYCSLRDYWTMFKNI